MDAGLLEIFVCPASKAALTHRRDRDELWCRASRLAYPVRDGIPFLLEEEARPLTPEELEALARP
ncbi:MAG: Trm112 family protein [Gammaproteobacteria bacterium]|nr:Trm112 family protein [Gammaproteobacteria bacterium]